MEVTFLGTSCMVPTKERNHNAIYVVHKGEGILVDCGEGTQKQLKIANIKPSKISTILLTHWHGDHVFGLPGLLQTLSSFDYDKTLKIYGPDGTTEKLKLMFKTFAFYPNFELKIFDIKKSTNFKLKNSTVRAELMKHSLPCVGYSIKGDDTRRIRPKTISDLGIPEGPLLGKLQNNESIIWKNKKISPKDTTYVVKGKKLTIIMDTLLCNNINSLATDADLLICESPYTSELEEKAAENFHLTAKQASLIASQNKVKKLILTHLSQRYKTPKNLLDEGKTYFDNTVVAHDFMTTKV